MRKLGDFPVGAKVRVGTPGYSTVHECVITDKSPGSVYVEWYEPVVLHVTDKKSYQQKDVQTRRRRSAAFSHASPAEAM